MSTQSFTHLHLHSQYSLLDGAIRLNDLYPRLHEYGMSSVALTDHGNMFGALDFYKSARKADIKPIFGCEVYITDRDRNDRSERRSFHFILLAKNEQGYRNLTYLVSMGYIEGFYYTPRIDKALLREHSNGLIGTTACLGGEAAQALFNRGSAAMEEVVSEYKTIFEPDSFYLELQPNGLTEQEELNERLIKLGAKLSIPLVATNDCHYLERKDAVAHDCLMCVQMGKQVSDKDRLKHEIDEYYVKSPQEMEQAFHHVPEALENTITIANMCDVTLDLGQTYLPNYKVPEGHDLESFLALQAREGLERRFAEAAALGRTVDKQVYKARLEHELEVIKSMGFPGYFLIVWDFINYAKQQHIPVGPGRGSGAGSLVAYSLRITDVDPLPYNLLFERFLNPERVSMPDFDIDFCMHRRDEVIKYVTEKYGHDNCGQIVTMHQLKARGVTRDVARALGMSFADADRVAKLIPEPIAGKSVSIPEARQQEPKLEELAQADDKVAQLLDIASSLEGLNRHWGTHAAGLVIGEKPLWEYVPCVRGQNGELVTQFAKNEVEEAGLVKFDFLGLKTLTVLSHAERLAKRDNPGFDLRSIPMDDKATFEMIQAGNTTGVFQLESSGFKELLKKLLPDCFEDIVAAVALYRPGPLKGGMVDDFIERKHGRKEVDYMHPQLEKILKETYGVIVYQEQVMQISSALAGYSLGQADLLRRAMGKKKEEEMVKQKRLFLEGAAEREVDAALAERVFDLMAMFAGYGFNKSHSVAYALITYQTAYLKAHFPPEFMAAVLTCDKDNTDALSKYIAETKAMGIPVLRPDVNESEADFTVVRAAMEERKEPVKAIRFGMGAVKNVGEGAVEAIIEGRQEGHFEGIFDFCERVDGRRVNKRVVEALIKSGAYDNIAERLSVTRAQLMAALDTAQERAAVTQRDRDSGQTSLFGLLEEASAATGQDDAATEEYPDVPDWAPQVRLSFEKENLGFYVSGHPLDRWVDDLRRHASASTVKLGDLPPGRDVSVGGIIAAYRERPLKSGKGRMAIFQLEDLEGQVEVVCFSRAFEQFEETLKADEPLLVTGRLKFEGEGENVEPRLQMNEAHALAELRTRKTSEVRLSLSADLVQDEQVEQLKDVLRRYRGDCPLIVELTIPKRSKTLLQLSERFCVEPTDDLLLDLERVFGAQVAHLR
ncbi:MAG: DNA polymerase III subunit alpha [Proteobacteria bacterium]|nr:MAG: DNA polymerase III subunit alpha [Pseudomonadota bacterium]